MLRAILLIGCLSTLTIGGCPPPSEPTSAVDAQLAISRTSGPAPLTVSVSAAGSTSSNAGALTYRWNFGDGTTATTETADHTYALPGRYVVSLTVTDALSEQDVASTEVRAAGTGATAVIAADKIEGSIPLLIRFDGTGSSAPDDVIRDYLWSFGDGATSVESQPQHQYTRVGSYTVSLTVTTAGGVSATTTTTITASERVASLQFTGVNFATLNLTGATTNPSQVEFTFETWMKPEADGGTIVSMAGGGLTLDVQPLSNNVRLQVSGTPTDGTVTSLAGNWRHVAIIYAGDDGSGAGTAAVYIDGVALLSAPVAGSVNVSSISLGVGYRGQLAEARLWQVVRTVIDLQATMNDRVTGLEANLLGYWRLDEGNGQRLANRGSDGTDGLLGSSNAIESADPAWSTEGPPI